MLYHHLAPNHISLPLGQMDRNVVHKQKPGNALNKSGTLTHMKDKITDLKNRISGNTTSRISKHE